MRFSRIALTAASTAVLAAIFVVLSHNPVSAAQDAPPQHREFPKPTNLKVLPKDMTGQQVHDLMQTWAGQLGSKCTACHVVDKTKTSPDGKPVLDFASDRKEEKETARKMYEMVEKINVEYISKIDSSGDPVSCGTCHRGHLGPEPFEPAKPAPPAPGQ
ncbi:MAG TPA: c-type cytochrome [Acidobacteriaceae bacterium]